MEDEICVKTAICTVLVLGLSGNMCAILVLSDILGRFNLIFTDDFISSTFDRYDLISTPFHIFSPI